jgi:hypothetical protein
MANGWESKSVEEQQAEASSAKPATPEVDQAAALAAAERKRRLQTLEMQRERVLSERTSSPHRRSALELALADIERELQQLGMSIKL